MKKKSPAKRPDAKQRLKTLPLKEGQAASVKGGMAVCAKGEHFKEAVIITGPSK